MANFAIVSVISMSVRRSQAISLIESRRCCY